MIELLSESLKEELIHTYNLGALRKEYRVTKAAVITGIVLIIAGFVVYGILYWFSLDASQDIAANMLLYGLIPLGCLSGIGSIVLLLGTRWVARRRHWCIYVYEHGLIYNGKEPFAMRWSSVKTIIHKITAHTSTDENGSHTSYTHSYKIYCYDGTELGSRGIISGTFAKKDELIHTIEQESAPYLLEEAMHNYIAGNNVGFGCITINKTGLTLYGQTLPWPDLKKFEIGGTQLHFKQNHKWLTWKSCELGAVANYEVFKQLANAIQTGTI